MSKTTENRIASIRTKALTVIPTLIKEGNHSLIVEERKNLNILLIETVLGATIEPAKKGNNTYKIHFMKSLPSISELAEICQIMDEYTRNHEVPYLATKKSAVGTDDIEVIDKNARYVGSYRKLNKIDKINKKKIKEELFTHGLINEALDSSAVMIIAAYGEEIRKKQIITTSIIIGGIAIAMVGGIATATYIHNKKKEDGCDDYDEDIIDIDITETSIDIVPQEDAPRVEIA